MIAAILRAQLLSMRLRKGRAARGGALFSGVTGLIFYGVFFFFGWMLMLLFSSERAADQFLSLLSAILLIITLYWQVGPVISASFGASIDLRKLLAYPIPRGKLFQIELLLRAMTSFDMVIVIAGIVDLAFAQSALWRSVCAGCDCGCADPDRDERCAFGGRQKLAGADSVPYALQGSVLCVAGTGEHHASATGASRT